MNQRLLFTTCIFFLPILKKVMIVNLLAAIQFDIKFVVVILVLLSALLIIATISFCRTLISWINSDYKWTKLLPSLISLMDIFCIYYLLKLMIDNERRRIKTTLQNIPNSLLNRNSELV